MIHNIMIPAPQGSLKAEASKVSVFSFKLKLELLKPKRTALCNYFRQLNIDHLPADATRIGSAAIKIASNLYLDSLFASLRPFLTNNVEPSQEFLDMKFTEALGCILMTDPAFYPTLFDFNEAWKIDLLKFMEEHFTEDMSIEDFTSFKGDLSQPSNATLQKYLHCLLRKGL